MSSQYTTETVSEHAADQLPTEASGSKSKNIATCCYAGCPSTLGVSVGVSGLSWFLVKTYVKPSKLDKLKTSASRTIGRKLFSVLDIE